MAFWGDYHTHTTYSHGTGSVFDNARVAKDRGLKQVAITDHGLRHMMLGIRRKDLPAMIADCRSATEEIGVRVLAGIENNFCSSDGLLDAKAEELELLDIVQGGYHKASWSPSIGQQFGFQFRNLFPSLTTKSEKKLIVKNTDAYLKLIDNYELDFIGHINRDIRADAVVVARYAKQKGTYIEINCKRQTIKDDELEKMIADGVMFVCNTDAHSSDKVGDFTVAEELIARMKIPYELIGNWERFPDFRSHNYKRALERGEEAGADKQGGGGHVD